jgi:hypothetical protein
MKSSKSAADITARETAVANMLANLRLEQLKPSESLSISIQDYIAGTKSIDDLLLEARIKYGLKSSK